MSDPPPKPKVGSLRDRIAAFEKGGASSSGPAPAPAPAPRPKPGGLQWKPKQPTPPDSPSAASADVSSSARSGMNASDAKASIGMGGSLKERMAALQKGGAFGSPAPPTAPKPAVEKPKWKPPPKVVPVDKDEDGDDNQSREARSLESIVGGRPSSGGSFKKVEDPAGEKAEGGDDEKEGDDAAPTGEGEEQPAEEAAEPNPEEEERQRRAALAARMAKLGGTRVGMAPMFGGGARPPPVAKKPKRLSTQEEPAAVKSADEGEPKEAEEPVHAPSPPAEKPQPKRQASTHSQVSLEPTPDRQDSVGSDASQARSPPTSMPMPTVARRAGPPRKKAVKSPEPATPPVVTSPEAGLGTDPLDRAGEEIKSTDVGSPPQGAEPEKKEEPETSDAMPPPPVEDKEELKEVLRTAPIATRQTSGYISDNEDNPPPVPEREEAPASRKASLEADIPVPHEEPIEEPPRSPSPVTAQEIVEEPKEVEPEELDEEAEEAARRKRIAEKMGKMGGVNPLALSGGLRGPTSPPLPPPPRRQSSGMSIEALPTSPPPPPLATKPASRKSSMDIPTSPPPIAPKPPSRKGSIVEEEENDETFTRAQAPADDIPQDIDRDFSDDEEINQSHETHPDVNTYHLDSDHRAPSPVSEEEITPSADDLTPGEGPAAAITPIQETSPPPPPLPNKATRPPSQQFNLPPPPPPPVRPPSEDDKHHAPPARNLPPPPPARLIPQLVEDADDEGNESDLTRSNYSEQGGKTSPGQAQPPPISSREPSDNEDDAPPRRVPYRQASQGNRYDEDADDDDSEPAVPVPHRDSQPVKKTGGHPRPPFRAVPLSPASSQGGPSDVESSDGEALQIPPRRRPDSPSGNNLPLVVPPPRIEAVEPSPLRQSYRMFERDEELEDAQDLETDEEERGRHESGRVKRSTDHLSPPPRGGEVLDEDEGDPIDPGFHSPPSRRTSTIGLSAPPASISPPPLAVSPPTQEKTPSPLEEPTVDEEQARRQTIAERMARLGGIKFGAAPPIAPRRAAPQAPPEDEGSPPAEEQDAAEPVEVDEEEEERARKERIAAKLAGMGGMRIGMMPMGLARPPQPPPRMTPENAPPAPPSRAPPGRPPPPPQHQESESDFDDLAASQPSLPASDDGVHVEAMESEIEEGYEDINESEPEDEVPPPIPDRGARRRGTGSESTEVPPPLPPGRPPVPVIPAIRKSSGQTTTPAGRKSSVESGRDAQTKPTLKSQQSEYVMVEEPAEFSDDVPPPLPPGRHTQARSPPTRNVPAPGPPARTSVDKQWDLGSSIEFSDTPDLALSWTEANDPPVPTQASTSYPPPPPPAREMPPAPPSHLSQPPIAERHYSADDLIAIWGRVGVQVCEVATALYEKSKKALIGDGTYEGFVHAVLSEVPNALIPQPPGHLEYGFVIYAQTGNTVQKRVNEVMPGDVVEIHDAKFKGHKGLQGYTQNIERLVGVVSEYEPKKSKVRVFQANQHVGHQTVEAVSYRFDDLKSGSVKIYRVLEN